MQSSVLLNFPLESEDPNENIKVFIKGYQRPQFHRAAITAAVVAPTHYLPIFSPNYVIPSLLIRSS